MYEVGAEKVIYQYSSYEFKLAAAAAADWSMALGVESSGGIELFDIAT
jgi:hypothetical protein